MTEDYLESCDEDELQELLKAWTQQEGPGHPTTMLITTHLVVQTSQTTKKETLTLPLAQQLLLYQERVCGVDHKHTWFAALLVAGATHHPCTHYPLTPHP